MIPDRGTSRQRFVPRVEWLEDRTTPDGNVTVGLGDQVLYVTGDASANRISITGFGKNSVVVQALDATTTINGRFGPVFISGVKEGYHIGLHEGDDVLVVESTRSRRGLFADTGDGNDFVRLAGAGHRGATTLRTGTGNDVVDLSRSQLRDFVGLDTGFGDDFVNADLMSGKGMFATNVQGTDFFNNSRSVWGRFELGGFQSGLPPVVTDAPPTVTLFSATPLNVGSGTIDFTATFSEDVSGFSSGGVAVTNGSVTAFTAVDARTYRFSVTPSGQGTVTTQVSAGAATDAGGNGNLASDPVTRAFDSVAPAAPTFDLAAASDSGAVGDFRTDVGTVTLTGTAEAGSTVTFFAATAGTAPGTGPVLGTATAAADGSFAFTISLNTGPNSFAATATDAAGNRSATFTQTFTRNVAPLTNGIPDQNLTTGNQQTLDLLDFYTDPERVVRLTVAYPTGQTGAIDINLFQNRAPNTVANFLSYVNADASVDQNANYNGAVFHRSIPGFVLQGGGFKFDDPNNAFPQVTDQAPVQNEPGVSNSRGTIAMAKLPNQPNSATNEFFFNLSDNSAGAPALDTQNSGFTVFAQVMNGGQQVVDAIAALPTFGGAGAPGGGPTPIRTGADTTAFPQNITAADLAVVTNAAELTAGQRMIFSVLGTSDATVATASVNGSILTINPIGPGTAVITVRATDLDGSVTDTTITVNVT